MDWNGWRLNYDSMTDEEHLAFYNELEKNYPEQKHFTQSNFDYLFSLLPKGANVLEVGGWKGELANACIDKHEVNKWLNIEICSEAIKKNACNNPRYSVHQPNIFRWWNTNVWFEPPHAIDDFNVVIASHMIEHLSNVDFLNLIDDLEINDVRCFAFEAPLTQRGQSWNDYIGTHILTLGWGSIDLLMAQRGFNPIVVNNSFRIYR